MKSDFEFGTVGPFESSIVRKPDKDEAARAARLQAEEDSRKLETACNKYYNS